MMELTNKNLESILKVPALRESILIALSRHGFGPGTLRKPVTKLDKDTLGYLHDAAYEALLDCGIVVESYEAEQDKGAYAINIIGVPGAYYVEAMEYDDMGFFETLEDARKAVRHRFGEFVISDPET